MSIFAQFYSMRSEIAGRPVIEETGLCTDDEKKALQECECGRLQFEAIPRRAGLAVKALDGRKITTHKIEEPEIGRHSTCVQSGITEFSFFAPKQPFGKFHNRYILAFRRTWVSTLPEK
jgi:hypothetical protein